MPDDESRLITTGTGSHTLQPISAVVRGAAAVGAVLYGVGLVITNLDLGRHGIVNLDLARPQYLMAGALWAFLCFTQLWSWQLTSKKLRKETSGRPLPTKCIAAGVAVLVAVILPAMILAALGYAPPSALRSTRGDVVALSVGWGITALNGFALMSIYDKAREWSGEGPLSLFGAFSNILPATGLHGTMMLLLALPLYVAVVFPSLPYELGGGRRPLVRLVLSETSPIVADALGLREPFDGRAVGPVVLILETSSQFVVAPTQVHQEYVSLGVDKRLVSTILYEKAKSPSLLLMR
jgi:hypothetical protein